MINESHFCALSVPVCVWVFRNWLWTLKRSAGHLGTWKWKRIHMYYFSCRFAKTNANEAVWITRWKSGHTLYRWSSQNHRPPNCNIFYTQHIRCVPRNLCCRHKFIGPPSYPIFVNKKHRISTKNSIKWKYIVTLNECMQNSQFTEAITYRLAYTHVWSHKCNDTPLPVEKLHFWMAAWRELQLWVESLKYSKRMFNTSIKRWKKQCESG